MKETIFNNLQKKFDYLFIGLGSANCLLILRLHNNGLLLNKNIGIIEPDSKSDNDRTFCFWATEKEVLNLEIKNLISYSWENIEINGITKQPINPLHYYHVKGIDLYNETKSILFKYSTRFFNTFLKENPLTNSNFFEIKLETEIIYALKVFDSRPPSFKVTQKNQSHLFQSFYGWKIKTVTNVFDTSTMVMMDFNIPQNNFTQFIYTLPYDEETALIELTRFGDQKLLNDEAQLILADYIDKMGFSYIILEHERGVIPMSSANLEVENYGENWINTGARANMLKSTTGYAFHAMAEDALLQMNAIKNSQVPKRSTKKLRFVFYDRLLLKILDETPENGKLIFETLFKKVPVTKVLSFLREKTNLLEEITIFSKLPKWLFIKTAFKDIYQQLKTLPILILPFVFTIVTLFLYYVNLETVSWGFLAIGFLTVGMSHGALDHLTSKTIINKKQLLYFILNYLLKSALLGLVWVFFPDAALIIFIAYSAWHFGQADFKEWRLKQGWQSFIWGLIVLSTILFFHFKELNNILQQIPNLKSVYFIKNINDKQLFVFQIVIIIAGILTAVFNQSKHVFLTMVYLLVSSMLPLLVSFGIYFIGQHSMHGWRHLNIGLNESSFSLWLKSLPFSIGGAFIILYFLLFAGPNLTGVFFIILACLSFPHVLSMHFFYNKTLINTFIKNKLSNKQIYP